MWIKMAFITRNEKIASCLFLIILTVSISKYFLFLPEKMDLMPVVKIKSLWTPPKRYQPIFKSIKKQGDKIEFDFAGDELLLLQALRSALHYYSEEQVAELSFQENNSILQMVLVISK